MGLDLQRHAALADPREVERTRLEQALFYYLRRCNIRVLQRLVLQARNACRAEELAEAQDLAPPRTPGH